jgi:hypothetical protein
MSDASEQQTNLFNFMVVRSPQIPSEEKLRRNYIFDECIVSAVLGQADLFSENSASQIGRLIYEKVFCPEPEPEPGTSFVSTEVVRPTPRIKNLAIVEEAVALLPKYYVPCAANDPLTQIVPAIAVETLAGRTYFERDGHLLVIPERLSDTGASWAFQLSRALELIRSAGNAAEIRALAPQLQKLFDAGSLYKAVFDANGHRAGFLANKRALFDNLYLLYVLRRAFSLSLEETIDGLRTLHIIEALAVDALISELRVAGDTSAENEDVYAMLQNIYPALQNWNFRSAVPGFPLVPSRARLREMLEATPVVHPLFARLHYFREPFNTIKPIGIGDLKVVRQSSLGYTLGDISHIDNVLENEHKSRTHRRLEKSEDTFSFSSDDRSETQRDTQSTDRFELKRETESVLNTALNVNAKASLTYNKSPVVASVSGGVAYTRTGNDVAKTAANFARETVDKAVQRVESKVSQQRSSTRLLETEETNVHSIDNKGGGGHLSGIYHWVNRRYRSQVYNFGKRVMFEFVVPEPAAFLVESRLFAFTSMLDVPQPPEVPDDESLPQDIEDLTPEKIDPAKFKELQKKYDLSAFEYPQEIKTIDLINPQNGRNYFDEHSINSTVWQARTFSIRVDAKRYCVTTVNVRGRLFFDGKRTAGDASTAQPYDQNTLDVRINGFQIPVLSRVDNEYAYWWYTDDSSGKFEVVGAPPIDSDMLSLFLGFWDIARFELSFHLTLKLDDNALYEWQASVYRKVLEVEQARVASINAQRQQIHQAEVSRYKSRLSEVKAAAVSDLLRGQSAAANRQLIIDELKKHCITMITKEFDANPADDTLSKLPAMGERDIEMLMRPFRVRKETQPTTAEFFPVKNSRSFPAIDISAATTKGRYVQFLEQAFEWQQIAYVLYPYFWTNQEHWVDAMSRQDPADPHFTAFLQAGSARVLVAVTPAYEDAVTHFIATGEPWDGGPAPVIGDALFLPIHNELRRQQDDLYGGTPDGNPWEFTLPTALVYLANSSTPLPVPSAPTPP